MANAAKQKGTAWETAIVRSLSAFFAGRFGLAPRRVAQSGQLDTGDIHGISPFIAQAKNYKNLTDGLREGLDGAEVQRVRAGELYGVAFVKRARKPVGGAYAVLTVATFARLLVRLRRAEALLEGVAKGEYERHILETVADAEGTFPSGSDGVTR